MRSCLQVRSCRSHGLSALIIAAITTVKATAIVARDAIETTLKAQARPTPIMATAAEATASAVAITSTTVSITTTIKDSSTAAAAASPLRRQSFWHCSRYLVLLVDVCDS